jgi:porphobilinogen synthase
MIIRPRRLRRTPVLRDMVRETRVTTRDFIFPLFVKHGRGIKDPIPSIPGHYHFSADTVVKEVEEIRSLRIPAVLIFGLPEKKDALGSYAYKEDEAVQMSVSAIKNKYPDMIVITDVCLCEYTDHGHCGLIKDGYIDNDTTIEVLARQALSHAKAGADFVGPSDMMDGRVGAIRKELDRNGFQESCPIRSNMHPHSMARSEKRQIPVLNSGTGQVIRWTRRMQMKQ